MSRTDSTGGSAQEKNVMQDLEMPKPLALAKSRLEPTTAVRRKTQVLVPLAIVLALAGLAAAASAAPSVAIVSPTEGATINSGSVPLTLDIQNFTLNGAAVGAAAVAGEGHYHIMLDGAYVKFDYTTSTFLSDVSEGTHEVTVELAENDHTLLGINASVNVTISPGAPRVAILSPASNASWLSSSVELRIRIDNFTLDAAAVGTANVAGRGHYHVNVNGGYFYFGATEFFNVTYLDAGASYTIRVALHNNDHSAVAPGVFDEIRITVASGATELKLDPTLFQKSVNSTSLAAGWTVSNFTIDAAAVGQASVAGRGHYHAWIDGVFLGPSAANPIDLMRLSAGQHTLLLELRNNNHSPLSPRVVDFTVFTVRAGAPGIEITSPLPATTIGLNFAAVTVAALNFSIVSADTPPNVAGQGHWHLLVDGTLAGMFYTASGVAVNLTAGTHTLRAELANIDHTPLADPVFDEVRVTVGGLVPTITLVAPAQGAILYGNSTAVTVSVANFTLAPSKVGTAAVNGEGHWHVFVDGVYSGNSATTSLTLSGLAPGDRVIRVALHNNDHSPLAVAVDAQAVVHVGALPTVRIISPSAGASLTASSVNVTVELSNFTLVAFAANPPNAVGQGHLHIYLDGVLFTMYSTTTVQVTNLTVGNHTIRVEIANNDHSTIAAPGNNATVTVAVAAPAEAPRPGGFLPGFEALWAVAAVGAVALVVSARRRR